MNTQYNEAGQGSRSLRAAALVLALLAGFLFSVFFVSVPLAALAIILALLSRGSGRLRGAAMAAIIIACISVSMSSASTVMLIRTIRSDPAVHLQVEQMLEGLNKYYGLEGDLKLTLPESVFGENLLPKYAPETAETEGKDPFAAGQGGEKEPDVPAPVPSLPGRDAPSFASST